VRPLMSRGIWRHLGLAPRFISAVGADAAGAQIRATMTAWGLATADLQTDPAHPTGAVQVSLHAGEPRYDIVPECAYDYVRVPEALTAGGVLYHGTLARRGPVSAATLAALKQAGPELLFVDVNLRDPWWSLAETRELVTDADWVKLNRDELMQLSDAATTEQADAIVVLAQQFLARYALSGLIVTLGAAGAFASDRRMPRRSLWRRRRRLMWSIRSVPGMRSRRWW
jgi:fructokinase